MDSGDYISIGSIVSKGPVNIIIQPGVSFVFEPNSSIKINGVVINDIGEKLLRLLADPEIMAKSAHKVPLNKN
jgi:glycosyltransferase involved in cell wall biosynthesis